MEKKYKINGIFDEMGVTLNEVMINYLVSFLDKELSWCENTDIFLEL